MTKTRFKKNSPILEAVYETASDLHSVGLISDERMNEYKESCLKPQSIILDDDVLAYLNKKCDFNSEKLRILINDLLRKEFETARSDS